MDIAVIYEKIKIAGSDSTYILKPVDVELGKVNESGVFKTECDKFYSYNDASKLNSEYVFYGNPIKVDTLAKQMKFNYGTPDYNYALAEVYYEKYVGNILSASINDDKVIVNQIDLSKMADSIVKEGMNKFIDENGYIAIMYEKSVAQHTENPTFVMKPIGIMYGKYNDEAELFKVDDEVYRSCGDKEAVLDSDIKTYFASVCKVSDLIDVDKDITKEEIEALSDKYLKNNLASILMCAGVEPFTVTRFNLDDLSHYAEQIELTDVDKIVIDSVNGAIEMLNKEINDDDKVIIYDFYKLLLRFLYMDGEINGIKAKDLTYAIYRQCLNSLEEIKFAIKSLGIDKELARLKPLEKPKTKPKKEEKRFVNTLSKIIYPEYSFDDLYKGITDVVVDQDEPVAEIVSVLYKRLVELHIDKNLPSQFGLIVTGSTGVGKSEIFKTFASIVDYPIQFMDATQITAAGYVGRDIESYLEELLDKCDGDIELASKAIMILDEVDKIKSDDVGGKDVGGKEVQNLFLKFMDGTEYNIGSQMFGGGETINTSSMTPISIGAFTDMGKEKSKPNLGFGGATPIQDSITKMNNNYQTADFVKYGMTEEFMGRHYIRTHLNDLNEKSLLNILKKSKKSPLKVQKAIFETLGIECTFTPEYQKAVASEAMKMKLGARSLAAIVANTTWVPIKEIDKNRGKYKKLVFTKECVKDPSKYKLYE